MDYNETVLLKVEVYSMLYYVVLSVASYLAAAKRTFYVGYWSAREGKAKQGVGE
jgi:hypothetical protein